MEDSLLKWREEFPILAKKTYLINNSLGAMPRKVRDGVIVSGERVGGQGPTQFDHLRGPVHVEGPGGRRHGQSCRS